MWIDAQTILVLLVHQKCSFFRAQHLCVIKVLCTGVEWMVDGLLEAICLSRHMEVVAHVLVGKLILAIDLLSVTSFTSSI